MPKFSQIKRWEVLTSLVRRRPYLSKSQLIDNLNEQYDIQNAGRTFERDLNKLTSELGVFITYDHHRKGYYIAEDNDEQVLSFLQFASRILLGDLFRDALNDFNELKEQVKPEEYAHYEGEEHLRPILLALRSQLEIRFIHENFQRNTRTPYQITPFQLREYERRWYVVGVPDGENHIKTFGLSRISDLRPRGLSTLNPSDFYHQLEKFNRIIGLNYDAHEKAELIRLLVDPNQYKYLKTLPLHRSQKKVQILSDGRIEMSLFLIPNYELKMQILKLGHLVEVLEPAFLREEIKEILKKSLENYRD